jgi:MFS family permease
MSHASQDTTACHQPESPAPLRTSDPNFHRGPLAGLGFAIPPSNVITLAVVQESSTDHRALATGIYHVLGFSAESVSSLTVGILGDLLGLDFAIAASAVLMLLSLPLVLLLPKAKPYPGGDEYLSPGPPRDQPPNSQG